MCIPMCMRTNIILDEGLVKQAFKYSQAKTKRGLVEVALKEYVENHQRRDLRELKGKISFHVKYDHKALR